MANDNRRSQKVKIDERNKSNKKTVTQNASPETSSSRRSSRETSSSKQTKEIPSSTRKSKRLEMNKQPESPPIIRKSLRNQEQVTTTPLKRYDRRKKHTSVSSSETKKLVEDPASLNKKSNNEKVKRSLKMDSKEDKQQEKKGRKRKRVTTLQKRTETSNENDKENQESQESQDESSHSHATSSSNKDVDNSKNENSESKSVEDKGDDDDDNDVEEHSNGTKEESTLKTSETQCSTSNSSLINFSVEEINDHVEIEKVEVEKVEGVINDDVKEEQSNDKFVDLEHVESIENGSVTPIISKSSSSKTTKKPDLDISTDIKEYWVPVQISNVQLEQYCSMLLTNSMALSSCSKSDTVGALHDILVSNRKCCDHPYIADQSIQAALTKDLELGKFLEVGIKASGKLQFLDLILPELRKRELRVLILFQPLSGTGKDSTSTGDILDDFVRQRFGVDSYERVDAVITTPAKRQTALNNFNNKEKGRFVFLLDYRACLPSIKLSSVDTIIIFDSDWNPANDLRALQKIAIDSYSQPENNIKIFRLYTSYTLEEKILKLSEHNVTIDKGLQNLSRSISDALLMWGATYLFSKLTEFHMANISPEEDSWNELMEDFLNLVSDKNYTAKLIITRGQQSCENFSLTSELTELPGGEQPHMFWKKLLAGRDPSWKYLTLSTPRQRKRPQFYESHEKVNPSGDDVGRKRKKTTHVIEKSEIKDGCTVISSDGSQLSPGDSISCAASCNETSFRHLLKLNISELCRVLKLSEEVKKKVEGFLEYVIENYQVNKEPANTLQAFLISLCWIGSSLLKKKLDKKQTLSIVKKRLNFTCEEEETNSVYMKLEEAKDMFLLHEKNQKKTNVSKEFNPRVVKIENLDIPEDQYITISPDTSDVAEDQNNSPGSNNSNSVPAPAPQENVPPTHALVSPPSGKSVPTDSVEIQTDSVKDAEKVDELITETPPVQQPEPNQPATDPWQSLFNIPEFENHNRGPTRISSCTDPLQAELEKLCELKNTVNHFYEAIRVKIKSDYEKERAEVLAKINRKYEEKSQKAEVAFYSKKNEIDVNFSKVITNKILADTFRSKCRDLNPFDHSQIQMLHQLHGQNSFSPGQTSGSQQVNKVHSMPQIVHQSANLFSHTPPPPPPPRPPPSNITSTKPPPTITPITPATRPPQPPPPPPPHRNHSSSQIRQPPHMNTKPPPNITSTTPSVRNTRLIGEIRAPAPHIRPFKPSTSPHEHASHRVMSSLPPSAATFSHTPAKPPLPPPSQTPPNHNSHPTQPPSSQTPPSFPTNHNSHPTPPAPPPPPPSSQTPTNQNSQPTQPPLPPSSQTPPSFPTNQNSHPTPPVAPPLPPPSQPQTNQNSNPTQPPLPPSSQTPPSFPTNQNSHSPPPVVPPPPPPSQTPTNHNSHPTPPVPPPLPPSSQTPTNHNSHPTPPVPPPLPPSSQTPTNHNSHQTPPVAPPLPPPSQTPTNQNSHTTQSAPPAQPSIQLPSLKTLHLEENPPGNPPATSSSSSLPPMPSIPITHTGLYNSSGGFMNLLMDVDKEAGSHQQTNNLLPSSSEVFWSTVFGKCGDGDLVCLSDDD